MTTSDRDTILEHIDETRRLAEKIARAGPTLPYEFQAKAAAKLRTLSGMQELVVNFARLESERLDRLQTLRLTQSEPGGHA